MRKKFILTSGIIIGICILGVVVYLVVSMFAKESVSDSTRPADPNAKVVPKKVCSDKVITEGSSAIAQNDMKSMERVANQIIALSDYDSDANCEYIIVRYYLASGDIDKAENSLNRLQTVLASGMTYSNLFNPSAVSIRDLRMTLNNQKRNSQTTDYDSYDSSN